MNTRHLLSNAQNGNFEAAVQVFLNYRDGAQNFEKSEEQAQIAFENVIKILDSVVGKKTYADPNRKPLVSVDEESNAIVVMGPSDEIEAIGTLVTELDKEKGQVYVQARIIELNDELVNQIGISYGIFAGSANNNGLTAFSSSLNVVRILFLWLKKQ